MASAALPGQFPFRSDVDNDLLPRGEPHPRVSTSSALHRPTPEATNSEKDSTGVSTEEVEMPPLEVVGSTTIYDDSGRIRLIPTPTPDPKDPLNLPLWRKYLAIGSLCFFGGLSLAGDMLVGGLLPVFLLEYSGLDPRPILKTANLKGNTSPLALIPPGVTPVSLYSVTLLSTLPSLTNCVATYFLIPLSLAIGRRPVLLATATLSWIGGFWAAYSTSLQMHIAARIVHGLGSATVEGLLPLIMQDMVFIHQRNRSIAAILVCQGPMMTIFGIISPYIATNYTWRWLYLITSGASVFAWLGLICFVPETRTMRSKQELNGQELWPIPPGKDRCDLDYATYGKRTLKDDIGILNRGFVWKETGIQMLRTLQSTYFPAVIMVILVDAMFFIILHSVGQTISFAMLAAGIPFELSGLHVITQLLSSAVVYVFGGPIADKLALWMSRVRKRPDREPEFTLPNLAFPFVCAMVGCAVFGVSQHNHWHVGVLLTGQFLLSVGVMTSFTILKTFIIESYPQWPGPVLVNVSTFRSIISFFFSSHAISWVQELGPLLVFGIYIGVLFVLFSVVPIFYFYGKKFRQWTSGRVADKGYDHDLNRATSRETMTSNESTAKLNRMMSMDTVISSNSTPTGDRNDMTIETVRESPSKKSLE